MDFKTNHSESLNSCIPNSSKAVQNFSLPALYLCGCMLGSSLCCGIRLPDSQRDIYWYTVYQFFLVFAIPFALITVAYKRILLKMARSSEAPMSQRSTRTQTKKLTCTALAICVAFFICWAPFHILQLAQPALTHPTLPFHYTYNVAISLGYANSCLNPFIYILLGQSFQRQLGVPVGPAAAGQASPHRSKSMPEDAIELGQPLLHLVSISGRQQDLMHHISFRVDLYLAQRQRSGSIWAKALCSCLQLP